MPSPKPRLVTAPVNHGDAQKTKAAAAASSMENYPPPMVSGEVDLTDFDFMPLDVRRLLQSEFWINAMVTDSRVAAASVNLWAVAWHQKPASSLPNVDAVLARFAMLDMLTWLEIRDAVLGPWVLCSDNRWYHPVVAEKAENSWAKMRGREAKAAAFSKRQSERAKRGWDAGRIAGRSATIRDNETEGDNETEILPSSTELSGSGATDVMLSKRKKWKYPDDFVEWWARYPVKKGKEHAFRAFLTARRMIGLDGLHKGLDSYFKYRAEYYGTKPPPHPWPAKWLIERRWEDGT